MDSLKAHEPPGLTYDLTTFSIRDFSSGSSVTPLVIGIKFAA